MTANDKKILTLLSLLCAILATLKVTGVIDWAWWWMLAPIWIPYAFLWGLLGTLALINRLAGR